ncbi:MAG: hypothetical protein RMK73_00780 [Geminicoccaceae bacterium]|nr:hypothetical protein [Geminicoccaceae bacterium]MDW8123938.1 hypothetical protein [Geminicoccaceae bacterium]MDW8339999.1 hypothetical protein [Geminicoccaceae bacterium]
MTAPVPARRGPRTPEGKARASLNALRHGLRARHFRLLPHEDPAEFEALARATREAYAPADAVERELVEAIAVALWRAMRVDRLEAEALADIPPADDSRSCGTDLDQEENRARLATLLRYRAQAELALRRAQQALERHRALRAPIALGRELACDAQASPATNRTNEFAAAEAAPAGEDGAPGARPERVPLRDAVRAARNPLDTPLLRALGRDPELVLPVPGMEPELWPFCQHLADPERAAREGLRPYRRVPHLPPGEWHRAQHLLAEMERSRRRAA